MHYQRMRHHGDTDLLPPQYTLACTVDGCEGKRIARGLCTVHYGQRRRGVRSAECTAERLERERRKAERAAARAAKAEERAAERDRRVEIKPAGMDPDRAVEIALAALAAAEVGADPERLWRGHG
jgi:hypothetical protein